MTQQRFKLARSFDEFKNGAKKHQGLWNGVYEHTDIPEDALNRLKNLPGRRHVVVLAEDWCGDAASIVPVLARMADAAPESMELRVLKRDENLDLMDTHLTHGGRSIPIAIVYDEDMQELGAWGPRPGPAQAMFRERLRKLERGELSDKSNDVYKPITIWYRKDRSQHTVNEFLNLLERGGRSRT